jgi:hypothetical protein
VDLTQSAGSNSECGETSFSPARSESTEGQSKRRALDGRVASPRAAIRRKFLPGQPTTPHKSRSLSRDGVASLRTQGGLCCSQLPSTMF